MREGRARGYDLAIISGTLAPGEALPAPGIQSLWATLVGTDEAPFQPMYLTFEQFLEERPGARGSPTGSPLSFLPGPVPLIAPTSRRRSSSPPVYHRDAQFQQAFRRTKSRLCG